MATLPNEWEIGCAHSHDTHYPGATARELSTEPERRIEGLYATCASHYRQVPIEVVIPQTVEDVMAIVEHKYDV